MTDSGDAEGANGPTVEGANGRLRRLAARALTPAALAWTAVFGAIVIAAIWLRYVDLATNPGGLYPDEGAEGLDALRLLHQPGFHADWLVWFQDDGGREALFAYIVAAAFRIFGETTLVLRGTAAAIGVAGVIGIGLLARRWGTVPALAAAAWAAGSLWLICVSRDGMRNTMVPLFTVIALAALIGWAARPSRRWAVAAGALTSLSTLYVYQPLKLLPLLGLLWLVWLRHSDPTTYSRLKASLVPFCAAFLVVAAPMLIVAITEPANYFGRAASVSALNTGQAGESLPIHIIRTLGLFGFFGDGNPRQDVGSIPLVPLPVAAIAALGVRRLWLDRARPDCSLILISLGVFLLPPLLAVEGDAPHSLRSLGLAAPLGVAIGLGTADLLAWARRFGRWLEARPLAVGRTVAGRAPRIVGGVAVVALFAGIALWSGQAYLNRPLKDRWDAFSYSTVALADAARDQPVAAVIVDGYGGMDILFLDFDSPPALVSPGTKIEPGRYSSVFASSRSALEKSLGTAAAASAEPIAWDPWGNAIVWQATP